jgi:AcrR family transcriptional regulator
MAQSDWLVGGDRRSAAAERIYAAAADLIARDGLTAFDIETLAARVHCSRATIYRCAGGKNAIRDVVMARSGERIVDAVRAAVDGLSGSRRIITAITVALAEIRTDPVGRLMISAIRDVRERTWLTESPTVARFATDINGLTDDDAEAGQWILRVLLSLLYWPVANAEDERRMLERFISPAFAPD